MSKTTNTQPPAKTTHGRELQVASLAIDLAEKQIREGKVSPLVHAHFLKVASTQAELDRKKIEQQMALMSAKEGAIKSSQNEEAMLEEAMNAFREYRGTQ